jgi:chemotaxis protein CheD
LGGLVENSIGVGLGERVISHKPDDILVAYGLGSCLGIGMYDPIQKLAGLLHAVLPDGQNGAERFCSRYVNSGIQGLFEDMLKAGATQNRLTIWVAGGANMLISGEFSRAFDVGNRNIDVARRKFEELRLPLAAIDVGGNLGRTVRLYVGTGRMTVRVIGGQEKEITPGGGAVWPKY